MLELKTVVLSTNGIFRGCKVKITSTREGSATNSSSVYFTLWPSQGLWQRPVEDHGFSFIVVLPVKFPVERPFVFCDEKQLLYHPNCDTLMVNSGFFPTTNMVYLPVLHECNWVIDTPLIDVVIQLIEILHEPNFGVAINADACDLSERNPARV